jgi:hypothetical protein
VWRARQTFPIGQYVAYTEEEFKAEVAARAAKQQLNKATTAQNEQ